MTTTKAKTANGTEVEIQPRGHGYCGMPVAELLIYFDHPQYGRSLAFCKNYDDRRGPAGAFGYASLGVSGEAHTPTFRYKTRAEGVKITIDRGTFDAAMAEAESMALAALEAEKVAEAEKAKAAASSCPDGFVACRRVWANGDLMTACYAAEDGTEVLASDLLESHGGWYRIPAADVEKARADTGRQARAEAEAKTKAAEARAEATRTAAETGQPVEVDRWTEGCDGSADECSTDLCRRLVLPDGSFEVRRTHTH